MYEPDVSIVVPCYRSASCLHPLATRVEQALEAAGRSFELVLVNDCSPDATWSVICELAESCDFVVGVDLRANVGQHNAIMAGLHQALGNIIIIMDDDLQHDPADIPRLCDALEEGSHDVVFANFADKQQAAWKNLGSLAVDRLGVHLFGKPPEIYMSPFKAIRAEVAREMLAYTGPYSYVDGILFTITSRIAQIDAVHHERYAGHGSFGLIRSLRLALELITSFSVTPLRVASIAGAAIAMLSFLLGTYFFFEALFFTRDVPGFAVLAVALFFLGGLQLVSIGLVGEYVGRIFITLNRRPQFSVREVRRRRPGD